MTIELRRWTDDELRDFVSAEMVRAVDERAKPVDLPGWLREPSNERGLWSHTMGDTHADDRIPIVRAWSACLERPGEVVETLTRNWHHASWQWLRARRLNLLNDDRVGAILIVGNHEGSAEDLAPG